jgi:ABC-type bacteriocin/lantibiotic exporter with double-glycine peptidase domain
MLFYAFLFAAVVFFILAYVVHAMYVRMGVLNKNLKDAIRSKQELQATLKEAMARGDRLQRSLDKLIFRRTELSDCLKAAQTDEEIACIRKLLEDDDPGAGHG